MTIRPPIRNKIEGTSPNTMKLKAIPNIGNNE